jgi:hypothetical protein
MKAVLRSCTLVLTLLALVGLPGDTLAQRRGPPALVGPVPPLDAAGCYFYRGRQWCGRYCYYEVNGKRYCQRWKRDAVPQAPAEFWPVEAEPGMK